MFDRSVGAGGSDDSRTASVRPPREARAGRVRQVRRSELRIEAMGPPGSRLGSDVPRLVDYLTTKGLKLPRRG